MLDGRVKTLHPRVHGGILADRRLADHRRQLLAAAIAPFELVVVNLYPFAAALERPGITFDELVEEIDIGGPSMVRAAAKNHANVAIVTSPARYDAVLAGARPTAGAIDDRLRRALAHRGVPPHRRLRRADRRGAARADGRGRPGLPDEPGLPGATDPYPASLTIALEKVETLRYGENPHQPAARYRRPGRDARRTGRSRSSAPPLQGKALSYNNVLDAAAAAALGRALRGPGVRHRQAHQPVRRRGARRRSSRRGQAALEADPVCAFGGVVALTRPVDRRGRRALVVDLPRDRRRPGVRRRTPSRSWPTKPNLRRPRSTRPWRDDAPAGRPPDPTGSIRTAGGAVLVDGAGHARRTTRRPGRCATRRAPTDAERCDLDLAWRLVRGVTSNAIVLVRDRRLVGMGCGQTSRVDAARQAVAKAHAMLGRRPHGGCRRAPRTRSSRSRTRSRSASRPGSRRSSSPAARCATPRSSPPSTPPAATMLMTGVRHFRH